MAINRYREPTSLFGLQRLNRILDEAFSGLPFPEQGSVITSTWFAPTDVSEDENSLRITMELPGVDPNDVRLSLENNVLTIRGEKKQQIDDNSERVHRFERTYGMFERTFVLPNTVDTDRIDARYENGVLHVGIPKAERAKPREIRVNASGSGSSEIRTGSQSQRVSSGNSQRSVGNDRTRDPEAEGSAGKSGR
ncbi:MAG TPA: Hsp20/alpha crystallin family protein [Gemmatimonadales bacterium]|nr:Hsp20/alpha crystallin family protein [Gemmatimonadales bacterium]